MSDPVIVALITSGFAFIGGLIEWTRRTNDRDHNRNAQKLDRIESKIDSHIVDHARGEFQ